MFQVFNCLTVEHDWRLVTLAAAVCLLASAAAISLFNRAKASRGMARMFWVGLDAAAGGCGIWATHFIAMLSYNPGFSVGYDVGLTTLSLIFAIAITGVGLHIALSRSSKWNAVGGGAIVGAGIAAMHFTGMLALELPGVMTFSFGLVFTSLLLGVALASAALIVASGRDNWWHGLAASVLLAIAILVLHFTAMGAVVVLPDPTRVVEEMSLSPTSLSLVVAGAAIFILGLCLVAALADRRSKDKLRAQKFLLDAALENMSQGLCMFDVDGRVTLFNERYVKMMGSSRDQLKGQSLLELFKQRKATGEFAGDPDQFFANIMADVRAGNASTKIVETVGGRALRIMKQPMVGGGWVATLEDITDWRNDQAQISHMAHHDPLTDLPNRTLFREKLEHALHDVKRKDHIAVLCLDLDHFKDINDSLGHPVGDDLLKEVSRRLVQSLRDNDTVARLGGDEFAIILIADEPYTSQISSLASRLVEVISEPYEIQSHRLVIGVSVGISMAPEDGSNPDQLLKNADMALYRAKADGRGTYRFFEAGMDARAQARRLLEIDLRDALARGEFDVYYQPIHDLGADAIIGFEALVRWNHPLRGLIQPLNFISLAEETGLIVPIGEWVLRKACMDAAGWSKRVCVAVNLSPAQFKNRNLVLSVRSALAVSGLAPERLELEITEAVLLQDSETTLETLHTLRGLGVRISMDDFGTGYSSLSYLRSFPFDKIKIDRSFIHELATRDDCMAIVRAVTGLGKSLGIATTAEGVETQQQLDILRAEGCNEVQGFLFNRPRPAVDVEKMLTQVSLRGVA